MTGPEALEGLAGHLTGELGRSPHTVRGYLSDLRSLLSHLDEHDADPADLDVPLIRSWLSKARERGSGRSTIARRVAAVRALTRYLHREGVLAVDPGPRLSTPAQQRHLPTVLDEEQARARIARTDKERASYYRYFTDQKWGLASNYDLCVNSAMAGIEGTVEVIAQFLERRQAAR